MEWTLDDAEEKIGFSGLIDFLILLLAYYTGLRRSEIVGLKVGYVDLHCVVFVFSGKVENGEKSRS